VTFGLARRWPDVVVTVVHPGWVRTKMSGDDAPLSAASNDEVGDRAVQDAVLTAVQRLIGTALP